MTMALRTIQRISNATTASGPKTDTFQEKYGQKERKSQHPNPTVIEGTKLILDNDFII
jgi:hypothetical protein